MSFLSTIYGELTLAYFVLSTLLVVRNPHSRLNWYSALFLFSLGLWGIGLIGFHLSPRLIDDDARIWGNICSIGAYSCASFFVLFALALTGHRPRLRPPYLYLLLFGLPLACIIVQWTDFGAAGLKEGRFGWFVVWHRSIWALLYHVYFASFMIAGLVLLAHRARTADRPELRKQAALIFWTTLVTQVLGTTTDVALPPSIRSQMPPLAVAFTVIWAVGLFASMTRYGLMVVTAQVAARDILATMLDSLFLLGPDRRLVVANRAGQELLGYGRNELKRRDAAGLFTYPDEFTSAFNHVIATGELSEVELSLQSKTGQAVPVAISARLMRGPGDAVLGSVWVLRDITEQKRARLAREAEEHRYRAVAEKLLQANDQLKRLSEAKSDFVAAASHDLRSPLTTIIEAIALTEDGTLGNVNPEQQKFLRLAREDAERLSDIIGNLLDVRKIEEDKMVTKPARVDVSQIIRHIYASNAAYARDQGLTLTLELPDEPLIAWCDPNHVFRIIDNLVSNAIKFTLNGGRVTLIGEPGTGEPRGVTVKVRDTGVGIPSDRQHRIFSRYERIEGDNRPLVSGTGLGLFLCKQLVEMNGGRIGFESVEQQGSTFYFSLPCAVWPA